MDTVSEHIKKAIAANLLWECMEWDMKHGPTQEQVDAFNVLFPGIGGEERQKLTLDDLEGPGKGHRQRIRENIERERWEAFNNDAPLVDGQKVVHIIERVLMGRPYKPMMIFLGSADDDEVQWFYDTAKAYQFHSVISAKATQQDVMTQHRATTRIRTASIQDDGSLLLHDYNPQPS